MTQRKYEKDVGPIFYVAKIPKGLHANVYGFKQFGVINTPVRIVRESFYRKLIKAYELLEERL